MKKAARKHGWRWWGGIALLLASGAAAALGLGEIRVKSRPGQPFLAEIPIVSSDPAEMERLQARLASPDTFERVGLQRPSGLVNTLNFAVAVSDDGQPVIRVSSADAVDQATVNFLIEVDWGQGRLVREYSALVSTPDTVAAAAEPVIDAPQPAPSSIIAREPEPPPPPAPEPAAATPPPTAPVPAPPPATPRATAVAPPRMPADGELAPVQRGQTLSQIARGLGGGHSLDQTMLALLRANPEAFIGGNINRLRQGAILRVPNSAELAQLGEAEATAMVRQQVAEWRQARRPVMQPLAAAGDAAPAQPGAAGKDTQRTAPARLEIAPAAADASARTGTTSGIQAGGEGDMLTNPSLQQAREDLAARDSEVQELRAQVAELEKIKQQQAQLIALKDSDLAAAQQRLAQAQGSEPAWPLWVALALAIAVLALAWLLAVRKRSRSPLPLKRSDSARLAAAMPGAATPPPDAVAGVVVSSGPAAAALDPQPEWSLSTLDGPTWHTGDAALAVAPLNAAPAGRERLELAIAYLDLGDVETARDLLNEVVAGDDTEARDEAAHLLRDLD